MSSGPTLEGLRLLLEGAVETLSADFGFVYLAEGGSLRRVAACASGDGPPAAVPEVLSAGGWRPEFHDSISGSPRLPAPLAKLARRVGLESWWILPLEEKGRMRGLLLLAWEASVEIDPDDWDRANTIKSLSESVLARVRRRGERFRSRPGAVVEAES